MEHNFYKNSPYEASSLPLKIPLVKIPLIRIVPIKDKTYERHSKKRMK